MSDVHSNFFHMPDEPFYESQQSSGNVGCFELTTNGSGSSVLENCYFQVGGYTFTAESMTLPSSWQTACETKGETALIALIVESAVSSAASAATVDVRVFDTIQELQDFQAESWYEIAIPLYYKNEKDVIVDMRFMPRTGMLEVYPSREG